MITERVVQKAFLRSLPVFAGYIVLGIGFGILAKSKGYGIWWALAMSLLIYGGSMQYVGIAIFNHIYWIFGGCIGSLLASVISFNTTGIDFSMTALFVTVFTDQWLKSKNHIYACTGVFCSLGSLLIFGASNFLIPAMLSIVVVMGILYQRRKIHV